MNNALGYWKSPWPGEDGGPSRLQIAPSINVRGKKAQIVSRMSIVSTMTVLRGPGEVFLLCHTGGDDAVSWVERIDPETLETVARSVDLVAGLFSGFGGVSNNSDMGNPISSYDSNSLSNPYAQTNLYGAN